MVSDVHTACAPDVRISRRRCLELSAAAGGGAAGASLAWAAEREHRDGTVPLRSASEQVPFDGPHQGGITTPQQEALHFAAFDLTADRVEEVAVLFRAWTVAARRLSAGVPLLAQRDVAGDHPPDSGETEGIGSARLTLTFGLGPSLFGSVGNDRFGLARHRPPSLVDLPPFPGDELEDGRVGGDICVQACADDPQVAFHAVRNLASLARGAAVLRWMQTGFRHAEAATPLTGRNLFGFRDGINNLDPADSDRMATNVWVADEGPGWLQGGTYMVVRRIRMRLEHWDSVPLSEQERTFGRHKRTGAPFGASEERARVDPTQLPPDCHVMQANPRRAGSEAERILRRSYSFSDGFERRFDELDAGLFFVCFQRDPRRQFIPIQTRLARADHMREYVFHTGSGIFALPPGTEPGGYLGQALFEAG